MDDWGTFAPGKTLTRAETAAMVARVARPELRERFTPADYAMFTAAYLKPADVLFTNGVTAGQYLPISRPSSTAWRPTAPPRAWSSTGLTPWTV